MCVSYAAQRIVELRGREEYAKLDPLVRAAVRERCRRSQPDGCALC
jgi:hypothetical protein